MRSRAAQLWILPLLLCLAGATVAASSVAAGVRVASTKRSSATQPRWCARHRHAPRGARRRHHCHTALRGVSPSHAPAPGAAGEASAGPLGAPSATTTLGSSAPASPLAPGQPAEATPPYSPPSVPRVQVTAVEYSLTLSRSVVPAGKVILEFVNQGQDEHNLNAAPPEGPVAGTFANIPSKGISDQQLILRPGTYTLFCSLLDHKQKGMKASLLVE